MAAKTFLEKNDLPQVYLDEVVAFIHKNTEGVTLGASDASAYVDPYTGASRYQSNSSSVPTSGATGGYTDPWSGRTLNAGPSSLGAPPPPSSSTQSSSASKKPKFNTVLPVETFLSFKTANLTALSKKLFELDAAMDAGVRMGDDERASVERLLRVVQEDGKGELKAREEDVQALCSVLERWESDKKFPCECRMTTRKTSPYIASLAPDRSYHQRNYSLVVLTPLPSLCVMLLFSLPS